MSSQKQRRPAVPKNTCPKTGIAQTRKMKPWGQRPRLSASENRVSENRVSENRVSENRVSENRVSENRVSENRVSENRVSENRGAERTLPSTLVTQALSAALDFDVPVAAPRRTHPTPAAGAHPFGPFAKGREPRTLALSGHQFLLSTEY